MEKPTLTHTMMKIWLYIHVKSEVSRVRKTASGILFSLPFAATADTQMKV